MQLYIINIFVYLLQHTLLLKLKNYFNIIILKSEKLYMVACHNVHGHNVHMSPLVVTWILCHFELNKKVPYFFRVFVIFYEVFSNLMYKFVYKIGKVKANCYFWTYPAKTFKNLETFGVPGSSSLLSSSYYVCVPYIELYWV